METQKMKKKVFILLLIFSCKENNATKDIKQNCLINNEQLFIEISEKILFNYYGKENIEQQKPYIVNFIKDSIWVLQGTQNNTVGGEFYIEMNCKDAKFIKIEHTK